MDRLRFVVPVQVDPGLGFFEEIETVHQAVEFLHKWPAGRRGPVYECALNCCSAALAGQMSVEDARRSMASFVKITGLSVSETMRPLPMGDFDALHRHIR